MVSRLLTLVILNLLISSCARLNNTKVDKVENVIDTVKLQNKCLVKDIKFFTIYSYDIPFPSKITDSLKSEKYELDFGDWRQGFSYKDNEVYFFINEGDNKVANIEKIKSDVKLAYDYNFVSVDNQFLIESGGVSVLRNDLHLKSNESLHSTILFLFDEKMVFFAKCQIEIGDERNETNEKFIESLICSFKSGIPSSRPNE